MICIWKTKCARNIKGLLDESQGLLSSFLYPETLTLSRHKLLTSIQLGGNLLVPSKRQGHFFLPDARCLTEMLRRSEVIRQNRYFLQHIVAILRMLS